MPNYEAHITYDARFADAVKLLGESAAMGFKFSRIDGDPLMGAKPYCYLTAYSDNALLLYSKVDAMTAILARRGILSLRKKIERIIYDTKTGINEIEEE